jgi:hypothetical protein
VSPAKTARVAKIVCDRDESIVRGDESLGAQAAICAARALLLGEA